MADPFDLQRFIDAQASRHVEAYAEHAAEDAAVFEAVLDHYFEGRHDERTVQLLRPMTTRERR